MSTLDRGKIDCPALVEYFLEAARPSHEWLVGMELEKMGVDARDGGPIPYDGGGASVRGVLEAYLAARGGDPILEGERLVGVDGPFGTVSLEPGGQIEWSSRPRATLPELRLDLGAHLQTMGQVGETAGIRWLDVAVHPELPVTSMSWMPKARYAIMRDFLRERGALSHRMMTQTASIQCAFDYSSAEDWALKFRAAALLAPVAVALFANSPRADGKETGYRSYRHAIWSETDPARCGVPSVVFDPGFGIASWVDWACDVPAMLFQRGRGLVTGHGEPFRDHLRRVGCEAVSLEDWELHLSTIFTDVRSYAYIEVRSADLLPDDLAFAVPAFWTGLLYHPDVLEAAVALGSSIATAEAWKVAMASAAQHGMNGLVAQTPISTLAARAIGLALFGLGNGAACAGDPGRAAAWLEALARRHALPLVEVTP